MILLNKNVISRDSQVKNNDIEVIINEYLLEFHKLKSHQ